MLLLTTCLTVCACRIPHLFTNYTQMYYVFKYICLLVALYTSDKISSLVVSCNKSFLIDYCTALFLRVLK